MGAKLTHTNLLLPRQHKILTSPFISGDMTSSPSLKSTLRLVTTPFKADNQNLLDRTPNPKQSPPLESNGTRRALAKSPAPSDNIITFSPTARSSPQAFMTNTLLTATHAIKSASFDFAESTTLLTNRAQIGENAAETPTRRSLFDLERMERFVV